MMNNCPFCHLISSVEIICESDICVAFFDGYPVSTGHALIIPKRHVPSYFDLTNEEREAMTQMMLDVKQRLDERFHPDGYKGTQGQVPVSLKRKIKNYDHTRIS